MNNQRKEKMAIIYTISLVVVIAILVISIIKTNSYNATVHQSTFTKSSLFTTEASESEDVAINAVPRDTTWSKTFDLNNEGLTEHNFEAFTYDFSINNNTNDQVDSLSFKMTLSTDVFLAQAWNGALEIHQFRDGEEITDTIPDLREYNPDDYKIETVTVDDESFVIMKAGDYFRYIPSSSANAMEVPIEPYEGTTPGFIIYVGIDKTMEESTLELEYTFNRLYTSEPLYWISIIGAAVWFIALIIAAITSAQIKKYQVRHERDNKIISESIETFTGFIDAKDEYTNGHSKRVAQYTKLIAKEMGYEGEELDRVYYIALLHDCGKIGVPDNILGKPGKLTDEEFQVIKSHTIRGGEILSSFKSLENAGEGALYHHERYDGKGYPEGRAGEDIPFIARMICVADSFDAMNSNRVYRNKLAKDHIINEIESNKGRQFDPKVADVMLRLIRNNKIVIKGK